MTGGSTKQTRPTSPASTSRLSGKSKGNRKAQRAAATSHTENPDRILATIRAVARHRGWIDRDDFLRDLARELGHQRLGSNIRQQLKNNVRTALRRKILEADGTNLRLFATTIDDYSYDYLRDVLMSVTRLRTLYHRDALNRSIAHHLGFTRLTPPTLRVLKSTLNSAIRRGMLERVGDELRRR